MISELWPSLRCIRTCMVEMGERGRSGFAIHRDGAAPNTLLCPKPRRLASLSHLLTPPKPHGPAEGDAGFELMDILLCKNEPEFREGTMAAHFSGSPPSRSSNPLIHDVQFNQKKFLCPPIFLEQRSPHASVATHPSCKKSSCSSSYGANPSKRIEGFTSSGSESHRGVPTLA